MGIFYSKINDEPKVFPIITTLLFLVVGLIALTMYVIPIYGVWQKELSGKAQLAEADWNRQIAIREAEAKRESAKALAQAEVERARGVAEANEIIGNSLKGNESYLRYLWIQSLGTNATTIYVPTEANLPILEATRMGR